MAKDLRRLKVGAKPICCQRARYGDTSGVDELWEPCYYSLSGKMILINIQFSIIIIHMILIFSWCDSPVLLIECLESHHDVYVK